MAKLTGNFRTVLSRIGMYLAILGPGLITSSAGNDAPGIATHSISGATYGYRFLWLLLLIVVGQAVVQEMASRMGAVTGKGTADLIRERFGLKMTAFAMFCLLLANLGTTVAEFAGVAAGTELFGINRYISVPLAALLVGFMVLGGSYRYVEKVLLVLCLSALSYVISGIVIRPPWGEVLQQATTLPPRYDSNLIVAMLATIGTTITPWGIVYIQASVADKGINLKEYHLTRLDVNFGAVWAGIVAGFVIICTAATLFAAGISVENAEQAAMALEPLVGSGARYLFAVGLLGASLLAASVLPLSTTYALCEAFGWERGLNQRPREARLFYGLYIGIIVLSVLTVLIPGIPLFQLMWFSQSANAILLPVLLVLIIKMANDRRIMGNWVNTRFQNIFSWALVIIIGLITLLLFALPLFGVTTPVS